MAIESLADALEREHREIDAGIEAFTVEEGMPDDGRAALTGAIRALRRHIYLEEEFLFPPLYQAGLAGPVFVMLREHAQIWATLDTLMRQLDCRDGTGTAAALVRQLTVQLQHHNLKEERILYPEVDEVVTGDATGRLRSFLDSGELPVEWVPVKART